MDTDLLGGRHVNPSSGRERFGDFATRWLEARDLGPRTRDTYASQLAHILVEFESVELRKITPSTVRAWHGRLAKSGLHANTVAKVYRLFRTMLDSAVDDGLIRVNRVHIKGAAVERAVERLPLDWNDVERIAEAIHPRFSALVWVGATSGLRFGELTGLTRRHVDLGERTLRVEQALTFIRGSVERVRVIETPFSAWEAVRGGSERPLQWQEFPCKRRDRGRFGTVSRGPWLTPVCRCSRHVVGTVCAVQASLDRPISRRHYSRRPPCRRRGPRRRARPPRRCAGSRPA